MANQKKTFMSVLLNGLVWENPTFVLMLGMCPTLAITTSGMNGIGMGLGFTLTLVVMSSIREVLGSGTWFGMEIPVLVDNNVSILTMAPGGFVIFGCLIALVNMIKRKKGQPNLTPGCECCAAAAACKKTSCEGSVEG